VNKSKLKNIDRRHKIKFKIRKKIKGTAEKPRLVVFRSLQHIYTQLVDDINGKTLLSISSNAKEIADKLSVEKSKIAKSKLIGKFTAEKALSQNISSVVFDRNGYLFHGRIKAVADGARENGLKF
jgi:large subunit ribosomal protein L18